MPVRLRLLALRVRIQLGGGMGSLIVLVFPCFRENLVVICNFFLFLCSLDNLLQKNVIVVFFENQISKWRSFEKRAIFDLLFTFFSYKNSFSTYLTHIHSCMFLTLLTLFALPSLKKKYEFIRYTVTNNYSIWSEKGIAL